MIEKEITVRVKNRSSNPLPEYQTPGAAGMDLRAFIEEPVVIKPLQTVKIETGLSFEIPRGYEGQVRARSGLAIKYGITITNGVGTIDSDYRGEVAIFLTNLSDKNYNIQPGERVAQIVFAPVSHVTLKESEMLTKTVRGTGGFGHTGIR